MNKKNAFFLFLIAPLITVFAQKPDTVTLDSCYNRAIEHHPINKNKEVINEIARSRKKNLTTNWYPSLELNGRISYQSDVTEIGDASIPSPQGEQSLDFPTPSKDQYKVSLDVNQTLYDGGTIRKAKNLEEHNRQIHLQEIQVELYKRKQQISQLYFTVLLLQQKSRQIKLIKSELLKRDSTIKAGIRNGILKPADQYALKAELIRVKQQISDIRHQQKAVIEALNQYTGMRLSDSMVWREPDPGWEPRNSIHRPENQLFESQREQISQQKNLVKAERMPKVYSFAQTGYGKPGLNMLSDEFDTFWMIGAGIKWNIWDWKKNKRNRQILELQKEKLNNQESVFTQNIQSSLEQERENIIRLEEMIKDDHKIIEARENVTQNAKNQLQNGTITTTEYIRELNEEKTARINLELHKIQLLQAKNNHQLLSGNL